MIYVRGGQIAAPHFIFIAISWMNESDHRHLSQGGLDHVSIFRDPIKKGAVQVIVHSHFVI